MMNNRRNFLKSTLAGLGVASGFATNLASFNAFAADTSGYKALVCVFFRGGIDGHDLVIPLDISSWNKFESIRENILRAYDRSPGGVPPRRRQNLLSLNSAASSGAVSDGREFAFSGEMPELRALYRANKLAVVGNVGPLLAPINRTDYQNGSSAIPPRLFSHNDQQSVWQAGQPEGARSGWGGRFGDIMQAASANSIAAFTTVNTSGQSVFVNGENVSGFGLTPSGGSNLDGMRGGLRSTRFEAAYLKSLRGVNKNRSHLIRNDIMDMTNNALINNAIISQAFSNSPGTSATFPNSTLGAQLAVVAKMIANRDSLGMKRQIFLVADGGFDTHSNQAETLGVKQLQISQALDAFYNETINMGMQDSITTFTASDFGRSLTPNTAGTDHGWGSHHFVMGGAVNGGQILGNIPEAEEGHDFEVGRGRLIPQVSVEQYAYPMARWFGLSAGEASDALPNLRSFNRDSLSNMFSVA